MSNPIDGSTNSASTPVQQTSTTTQAVVSAGYSSSNSQSQVSGNEADDGAAELAEPSWVYKPSTNFMSDVISDRLQGFQSTLAAYNNRIAEGTVDINSTTFILMMFKSMVQDLKALNQANSITSESDKRQLSADNYNKKLDYKSKIDTNSIEISSLTAELSGLQNLLHAISVKPESELSELEQAELAKLRSQIAIKQATLNQLRASNTKMQLSISAMELLSATVGSGDEIPRVNNDIIDPQNKDYYEKAGEQRLRDLFAELNTLEKVLQLEGIDLAFQQADEKELQRSDRLMQLIRESPEVQQQAPDIPVMGTKAQEFSPRQLTQSFGTIPLSFIAIEASQVTPPTQEQWDDFDEAFSILSDVGEPVADLEQAANTIVMSALQNREASENDIRRANPA